MDLLLQAAELQNPRQVVPKAGEGELDRGLRYGRENNCSAGGVRKNGLESSPFATFAHSAIGRLEELGQSMRE